MSKEQLLLAIEAKKVEIAEKSSLLKQAELALNNMEQDPAAWFDDELTDCFDQFLDELYQDAFDALPVSVGNGVASKIIKNEDEIFYRTAYNDWLDDSDNYDLHEFEEYADQNNLVESLQSELYDLECDLDELVCNLEYLLDEEID